MTKSQRQHLGLLIVMVAISIRTDLEWLRIATMIMSYGSFYLFAFYDED